MTKYEKYIGRLKKIKPKFDSASLYFKIETRLQKKVPNYKFLAVGLIALILVVFSYYGGQQGFIINRTDTFAEYVTQPNDADEDPLMDYVLN